MFNFFWLPVNVRRAVDIKRFEQGGVTDVTCEIPICIIFVYIAYSFLVIEPKCLVYYDLIWTPFLVTFRRLQCGPIQTNGKRNCHDQWYKRTAQYYHYLEITFYFLCTSYQHLPTKNKIILYLSSLITSYFWKR